MKHPISGYYPDKLKPKSVVFDSFFAQSRFLALFLFQKLSSLESAILFFRA